MVDLARHVGHRSFCVKRNASKPLSQCWERNAGTRSLTASRSTRATERGCRTRVRGWKRSARGSSFVRRGRAERDDSNPPALGTALASLLAVLVNVGRAAEGGADGPEPTF
jgi:hypothetical protein